VRRDAIARDARMNREEASIVALHKHNNTPYLYACICLPRRRQLQKCRLTEKWREPEQEKTSAQSSRYVIFSAKSHICVLLVLSSRVRRDAIARDARMNREEASIVALHKPLR
jgi:hypothetical protein